MYLRPAHVAFQQDESAYPPWTGTIVGFTFDFSSLLGAAADGAKPLCSSHSSCMETGRESDRKAPRCIAAP
jgi:hypothetical protein